MSFLISRASLILCLSVANLLCRSADERLETFVSDFYNATPRNFNKAEFWHELRACLKAGADLSAVDINVQNYNTGVTMLHCVARLGEKELVRALLRSGADPDIIDNVFYFTSLHYAAAHGHAAILEQLCRYSKKIDAQDKDRQTPLHHAAMKGHYDACNVLKQYKARTTMIDRYGHLAVDYARQRGYDEIVDLLNS